MCNVIVVIIVISIVVVIIIVIVVRPGAGLPHLRGGREGLQPGALQPRLQA